MEYTVKALAELAGVTPRTLRWYDRQGLVKPGRLTEAGYRLYGEEEVDRLQTVLFYRELGLELSAIKALLDRPGFDRGRALEEHLRALEEKRARLDALILTVRRTIASERGEYIMTDKEKFEGFKREALAENESKYGDELREKYSGEVLEASRERFSKLTREQYDRMTALEGEIRARLEGAVSAGEDPAGAEGQAITALHREWLGFTLPGYTPELHRGLGEMYVADERFTAYYDRAVPGCAAFLRQAIGAYTREM